MKQAVKTFKDAFENAVSVYDKLATGQIVPAKEEDHAIKQLQSSYQSFCDTLYRVLDQYTDWNTQTDVLYEGIRREINNSRMFGDEFRQNNCAPCLDCLRIFGAIRKASLWFSEDVRWRLRSFQYNYKRGYLGVHNNISVSFPDVRTPLAATSLSLPDTSHCLRQDKTFSDFLTVNDKPALIQRIGGIIHDAKAKKIATIIRALIGQGWLNFTTGECAALCRALSEEYKIVINRTDVSRYLSSGVRSMAITDSDIGAMLSLLTS